MSIDPELRQHLVCPACRGELRDDEASGRVEALICDACKLRYAVQDDTPVLVVELARAVRER